LANGSLLRLVEFRICGENHQNEGDGTFAVRFAPMIQHILGTGSPTGRAIILFPPTTVCKATSVKFAVTSSISAIFLA